MFLHRKGQFVPQCSTFSKDALLMKNRYVCIYIIPHTLCAFFEKRNANKSILICDTMCRVLEIRNNCSQLNSGLTEAQIWLWEQLVTHCVTFLNVLTFMYILLNWHALRTIFKKCLANKKNRYIMYLYNWSRTAWLFSIVNSLRSLFISWNSLQILRGPFPLHPNQLLPLVVFFVRSHLLLHHLLGHVLQLL